MPAYGVGVCVDVGQKVGGSCDLGVQPWAGVAVGGRGVGVGVGRSAVSFSRVLHGPISLLGHRTVAEFRIGSTLLGSKFTE